MSQRPTLDPAGALAAFGRASYADLTSVVALSVAFWLVAAPLVTVGPAVLGIAAATHDGVAGRTAGETRSERDRLRLFAATVRGQFRRGLWLSVPPLAVAAVTGWYAGVAVATRSGPLLLGAVVGVYALVAVCVATFRAATLLVREDAPAAPRALWDAGRHLLETPAFSALHALFFALVTALCLGLGVAVVLLLPGLLAVLEVVAYEETAGGGAIRVVKAYRGELLAEGER
ncbi:hypothetical protein [Halobaculum sp. EA56]|uniref:hypothetical protein n=1 Tax=Halobaculum sp. EA56 TaxID=3421648 RepID=UPI003EBF8819